MLSHHPGRPKSISSSLLDQISDSEDEMHHQSYNRITEDHNSEPGHTPVDATNLRRSLARYKNARHYKMPTFIAISDYTVRCRRDYCVERHLDLAWSGTMREQMNKWRLSNGWL